LNAEQLLREELMKQAQNANVLVNRCDDPEIKRKLESAARRIASNMDELFEKVCNPWALPKMLGQRSSYKKSV
jgi:hypothetical protein